MKKRKLFFILICQFFMGSLYAQIKVDTEKDIIEVVKMLEGPGVKISNINVHLSPNAQYKPAGYFRDDYGIVGLDKGLLITTGAALNAIGPNNDKAKSESNDDNYEDPDLKDLISFGGMTQDPCFVEFDLVSSFPTLSFNYVFASEEYLEYLSYNDVFAFIISGPGIVGKKNIALIPGTNEPVSVSNINPKTPYRKYYINNGDGSTPFINIDMQYDGYTTVMKATQAVIPCETYHIKLIIADYGDSAMDSGVFIEQGSFKASDINVKVMYENSRFKTSMEGCNKAYVVFNRPHYFDKTKEIKYFFKIKGNAINDVDYVHVADSVIIPPGLDSGYITIDPISDAIEDDNEYVRLVIRSKCTGFVDSDSLDILIKEKFYYKIPDVKICDKQPIFLNANPDLRDSVFWNTNLPLNCFDCHSPIATPSDTMYFPFMVKDTLSDCFFYDSLKVDLIKLKADFNYYNDNCYTTLDYFFQNKSINASNYFWEFGDGKSSSEENPLHEYPFINSKEPLQYTVKLTISRENPSCSLDTSITITINNPLFIPNLITSDNNGKNETFHILGMNTSCWNFKLYNRWGNKVYEDDNYTNDFTGDDIDGGIYFFNITNHAKDREFNGWLNIVK